MKPIKERNIVNSVICGIHYMICGFHDEARGVLGLNVRGAKLKIIY
jgi:hypothetical protein